MMAWRLLLAMAAGLWSASGATLNTGSLRPSECPIMATTVLAGKAPAHQGPGQCPSPGLCQWAGPGPPKGPWTEPSMGAPFWAPPFHGTLRKFHFPLASLPDTENVHSLTGRGGGRRSRHAAHGRWASVRYGSILRARVPSSTRQRSWPGALADASLQPTRRRTATARTHTPICLSDIREAPLRMGCSGAPFGFALVFAASGCSAISTRRASAVGLASRAASGPSVRFRAPTDAEASGPTCTHVSALRPPNRIPPAAPLNFALETICLAQ